MSNWDSNLSFRPSDNRWLFPLCAQSRLYQPRYHGRWTQTITVSECISVYLAFSGLSSRPLSQTEVVWPKTEPPAAPRSLGPEWPEPREGDMEARGVFPKRQRRGVSVCYGMIEFLQGASSAPVRKKYISIIELLYCCRYRMFSSGLIPVDRFYTC